MAKRRQTKAASNEPKEYQRQKTGRLVRCPGEAHSNAHIDHCGICAPRWGWVDELAPVDLDAARAARLDVAIGDLSDAQIEQIDREGLGQVVRVTREGRHGSRSSYCVIRWTEPVTPAELPQ